MPDFINLLLAGVLIVITLVLLLGGIFKNRRSQEERLAPNEKRTKVGTPLDMLLVRLSYAAFGWEFLGDSSKRTTSHDEQGGLHFGKERYYYFARQKGYSGNPIFILSEVVSHLVRFTRKVAFWVGLLAFIAMAIASGIDFDGTIAVLVASIGLIAYVVSVALNILCMIIGVVCRMLGSGASRELSDGDRRTAYRHKSTSIANDEYDAQREYEWESAQAEIAGERYQAEQERQMLARQRELETQYEQGLSEMNFYAKKLADEGGLSATDWDRYFILNSQLQSIAFEYGDEDAVAELESAAQYVSRYGKKWR